MKTLACVTLAIFGVFGTPAVGHQEHVWKKEFTLDDFQQMNSIYVFREWTQSFKRHYSSIDEETRRFKIWYENLGRIASTNSKNLSYKLRLNQFADLTDDEFRVKVHGHAGSCYRDDLQKSKIPKISTKVNQKKLVDTPQVPAPASVNWVTAGVVTPVKNQGDCGSCWAFSTTGSIECEYAIKTGQLNSLSEQQLVDCSSSYGNEGCNGGLMDWAFEYVMSEGGLCSESEYPYTGVDGTCQTCSTLYNPITTYTDVTADDETDLTTAAALGCVSVAIEADQYAFQYYSSGILTGLCGTALDHGVLVVGYGTSGTQEYWLVKNSWGTSWGEAGYVQICKDCDANGTEGECGINMEPSYPAAA